MRITQVEAFTIRYPLREPIRDATHDLTLYELPQVMEGEALGEIIDALITEHQAALLAAESDAKSEARS